MLADARAATGLAIVTEIMTPQHVDLVCQYADVWRSAPATCRTIPCCRPWAKRVKPSS